MDKAKRIANKQKQISISEFFEKNKHFLGFDTHQRAVITAVKEAVDNSLDACEEGRILPEIQVEIKRLEGDRLELVTQDNGPGIPRDSIANVFGKFLLGSRFHAIRQTRGQQGIGITGVVMYAQLTTGSTTTVLSKIETESTAARDVGHAGTETRHRPTPPRPARRSRGSGPLQLARHGLRQVGERPRASAQRRRRRTWRRAAPPTSYTFFPY